MKYIYIVLILLSIGTVTAVAQKTTDSLFVQKISAEQLTDSTSANRFDYAFYTAQSYKNRGKFDDAIKEYQKCLSIDSTNAAAWFELSRMYQFTNNPNAYNTLLKAIKYAPKNDYYKEIEAAYCINNKEYGKAIRIFEKLAKANKRKTSYLYHLLKLYEVTGKEAKHLSTIKKIETIKGISEETVMIKIGYYYKKAQHSKALEEINKLIEKYPNNVEYQTLTGQYLLSIRDTAAALNSLNAILDKHPNNGYVYMVLFEYYKAKKDEPKLRNALNKIIEDNNIDISEKIPMFTNYIEQLEKQGKEIDVYNFFTTLIENYQKESVVYSLYGAYLLEQKELDKAEDLLNTAISINPDDEATWNMLVQIQVQKDSIPKLLRIVDEAEKIFPDNSTWAYYKVTSMVQLKKEKEAIALIDSYVQKFDDKDNAFNSLILSIKGDCLMQDSLYSEAFESYDKSLSYNPGNILTLNNYAYFLSECNTDLAKAEKMSSLVIANEPQNSTYLDTYAWILFKQGDLNGAKFHIERALLYGDDPDILEHYGDILFKLGNEQKALEQWQKSKDKGNTSPTLQKKIEEKRYIEKEMKCK